MAVLTTSSTPAGTYTITITGTSGSLSHSTTVNLTVTVNGPDFTISALPASQTIPRGAIALYTVTVIPVNGFSDTVTFSVAGLRNQDTATFSPPSVIGTGTSVMAVNTAAKGPPGTVTLTISGTSGNLSHSTDVTLILTPQ